MSVHIFMVDENNYQICVRRGLVGLPEPKDNSPRNKTVFDGLLSRLAAIKENDYILMYVAGKKELRGVWQAEGKPFYDETKVWEDRIYPFRCKIKCTEYNFTNPISLNDVNDLRNSGKIWTWALQRTSGTNAMFSISDQEFEILLDEYIKINPFTICQNRIPEPYPFHDGNIVNNIHIEKSNPKYESSLMVLLNDAFANERFTEIFGNYTDYLSYVPTNLGREMDIMLMFGNPKDSNQIMSYDIIEVKRDEFDCKALAQLIDYESWFLQKKVSGDLNMVRTTAIAKSFSKDAIDYVTKRSQIERKPIKLLEYSIDSNNNLELKQIF